MKKLLFLTCIVMLNSHNIKAQITYEKSYPTFSPEYGIFFITDIGYDNYKYVLQDCYSDQFNLYNLDHSPFLLNIQIPITSDSCTRFSVGFITSALFDCDSSTVEYALLPETPIYPFKVYRTDGTQLFSKDSVYGYWCYGCQESSTEIKTIVNTPTGTKMYLHYPWTDPDSVLVYGLCGTLPVDIIEMTQSSAYVKIFPNPTSSQINFQVAAPNSFEKYELIIFNAAFQTVNKVEITGATTQVNLGGHSFDSGTYFYSLKNKTKVFQTGKFIFSK